MERKWIFRVFHALKSSVRIFIVFSRSCNDLFYSSHTMYIDTEYELHWIKWKWKLYQIVHSLCVCKILHLLELSFHRQDRSSLYSCSIKCCQAEPFCTIRIRLGVQFLLIFTCRHGSFSTTTALSAQQTCLVPNEREKHYRSCKGVSFELVWSLRLSFPCRYRRVLPAIVGRGTKKFIKLRAQKTSSGIHIWRTHFQRENTCRWLAGDVEVSATIVDFLERNGSELVSSYF